MNESTSTTSQPARRPSRAWRACQSALGAVLATTVAIVTLVIVGVISWPVARGIQGIGISAAAGAAVGWVLRGPGSRAARLNGGLAGGVVAGYFLVASSEIFPPGTREWAYKGGANGALFSLPIAAIAAVLTEIFPGKGH
jgi:hypothetical protein